MIQNSFRKTATWSPCPPWPVLVPWPRGRVPRAEVVAVPMVVAVLPGVDRCVAGVQVLVFVHAANIYPRGVYVNGGACPARRTAACAGTGGHRRGGAVRA